LFQNGIKKIWIIKYGSASPSLTHDIINKYTALNVDECYTTTDQALKYTLIHLEKRVRETSIQRMLAVMRVKFGIILAKGKFGDAIISLDRDEHVGLKLDDVATLQWIVRDRQLKKPWYEEWISEKRHGKGILDTIFTVINKERTTLLGTTTKRQLVQKLEIAEKKLEALAGEQTMGEYDVVKKQRTIQAASDFVGFDVSSVILGSEEAAVYFQAFSSEVLNALQRLCIRDLELRVEDDAVVLAASKPRVGYVYGVGNSCLGPNMYKIGATFRDSPWPRIKELSKCLPAEFYIVSLVACTKPFEIEKKAHMHFADKRVWKESTGRKTEFFLITEDELSNYFAELNQELVSVD
jgi:hypothetical protein